MTFINENRKSYLQILTTEAYDSFNEEAFKKSLDKIENDSESSKAFNKRVAFLQKTRKKREVTMPVTKEFWTKAEEAIAYFAKPDNPNTELTIPTSSEGVTQRQARELFNDYISQSGQHFNKTPKMFGKLMHLLQTVKQMSEEQAKAYYQKLNFAQTNAMISKLDTASASVAS